MISCRLEYLPAIAIILLVSMTLHEIAHGYVAYRMGDPTAKSHGRLSLNPIHHLDPIGTAMFAVTYLFTGIIFGWAKPVPISPFYFKNHRRGMALVCIAGPITNFCLAAVFWAVLRLLQPALIPSFGQMSNVQYAVSYVLFLGLELNVVLGVFNLIPIPPLDGSRILGVFLPARMYARWASLDQYGWVFIIALILLLNYSGSSVIGNAYTSIFHWLVPAYV